MASGKVFLKVKNNFDLFSFIFVWSCYFIKIKFVPKSPGSSGFQKLSIQIYFWRCLYFYTKKSQGPDKISNYLLKKITPYILKDI